MARRRGRYKMTPRRRQALRKAQAASARKRRGQGFKNAVKLTGQVGGTILLGAAMWNLEDAARHPGRTVDRVKQGHRWLSGKFNKGIDPNAPGHAMGRPIKYYGFGSNTKRINTGVGGRRISSRQRKLR